MEENQGVGGVVNETTDPQKVFTQDEVNKLIGREKSRAAEHARREVEERYASQSDATNARMQQEQRNAQTSREVDAGSITKTVMENLQKEFQEKQLKAQMEQVANNYLQKHAEGKKNYEDFEEVTKEFDPTAFPQLTFLVAGLENGGDIIYELSKNPNKLANIDFLAQRSPRMAQAELQKLSKSITDNRQAQSDAQSQTIPDPLDRLSPSRIVGSNGKMSISEMRKQPWLRG
jgi:hypothetical protein